MAETILAKLAVEVTAKATQFGKVLGQQETALKKFQGTVSGVSTFLKGALATIGAAALGREIIDVTAEFQKFSAVLTNTLGSRSAAQIALRDIEEFAKRTPFAVDELTSSYVKLANQGFKPTTDELRKLGDLASSTGKGFDQLTEAIIDAQTGEFERLKEFGIRASKQGDQVKFTFKGVETQTKFTSQAIRDYILSLGDAEGVSGAMAAISETLGGQISNLGDSWTQLLKTIGDGNKGPLSAAIKGLGELVDKAREFVKTNNQVKEELQVEGQSAILEDLKELVSITGDVDASAATLISRLEGEKEAIVDLAAPLFANFQANEEEIKILEQKASVIDAQIIAIRDYTKEEIKRAEATEQATKKERASIGIIGDIEKQLKALETQKKASFSVDEITKFNVKIEELREKLEVLNASRPLSNFAAQQLKNATAGIQTDVKTPSLDLSGAVGFGDQIEIPAPDMTKAQEAFAEMKRLYEETGIVAKNYGEQARLANELDTNSRIEATNAALQYGEAVGDALGSAISGQQTFATAMKRLTADLLKTFLARALGGIIASAATSGGPPPVAIALAAAGVAAISAMFAKIGGPSKSVSGGLASTSSSNSNFKKQIANEQIVLIGGEIRWNGSALTLAIDKANKQRERGG